MKPSEKIIELRGEMSRPQFAKKFNTKPHVIRHIEEGTQSVPDELALALEKEYNIPFKWWKTGEGSMDPVKSIQEMQAEAEAKVHPKVTELFNKYMETDDDKYLIQMDAFIRGLKAGRKE